MKPSSRHLGALAAGVLVLGLAACNNSATTQPDDGASTAPTDMPATTIQGAATSGVSAITGAPTAAATSAGLGSTYDTLFAEGKYVDALAAYNGKQDVIFVDARQQTDYEAAHIPGALSMPYFEMSEGAPEQANHMAQLPKDKWIVTYCECPHAEAEQVADALLAHGYTMVKVIDEGLQGWEAQGGQTASGPPPAQG
jgi:rhodanese-related sulfurtransferase